MRCFVVVWFFVLIVVISWLFCCLCIVVFDVFIVFIFDEILKMRRMKLCL